MSADLLGTWKSFGTWSAGCLSAQNMDPQASARSWLNWDIHWLKWEQKSYLCQYVNIYCIYVHIGYRQYIHIHMYMYMQRLVFLITYIQKTNIWSIRMTLLTWMNVDINEPLAFKKHLSRPQISGCSARCRLHLKYFNRILLPTRELKTQKSSSV